MIRNQDMILPLQPLVMLILYTVSKKDKKQKKYHQRKDTASVQEHRFPLLVMRCSKAYQHTENAPVFNSCQCFNFLVMQLPVRQIIKASLLRMDTYFGIIFLCVECVHECTTRRHTGYVLPCSCPFICC